MSFKVLSRILNYNANFMKPIIASKMGVQRNIYQNTQLCASDIKQEHKIRTMAEMNVELAKSMGVESGYKPIPSNRSNLMEYLPKSQDELPKRKMQDSFLIGLIPLSKDKELQDKYITFLGHVRVGRLLEDMDIFAVMIAKKHIHNPNLPENVSFPQTLVTALVDRIDFTDFVPKPQEDIKISGHVSWAGNSSMEVVVWLEQELHGTWQRITRALFVIAARDPTNKKSAFVNAIEPANEREKEILAGGEDRKRKRIQLQKRHVSKTIPDANEQNIIHDLYLRTLDENEMRLTTRFLPAGYVWMSDATVSNVVFSHPENRNLHNTLFGGFIMRQAVELTWTLCYTFTKYRPKLKSMSDINFQKPIAVNSLLKMHAHVVYTEMNYLQVIVFAETYNPVTGKNDTTNTFHLTCEIPEMVHKVMPLTYHEAMMYIDGRRHFKEVMKNNDNHFVYEGTQSFESFTSKL